MVEASQTFEFELVEPERVVIDGPMWQAVMPGVEGDFGVRVNHSALVSALRPGIVKIWRSSDEVPHEYFVGGGFADVTAANCTILAEEVIEVRDLSRPHLEQELQELQDKLALADNSVQRAVAERKMGVVQAKLAAIRDN